MSTIKFKTEAEKADERIVELLNELVANYSKEEPETIKMTVKKASQILKTHEEKVGFYKTDDYCLEHCPTCRSGECEKAISVLWADKNQRINEENQRPRDEHAAIMPAIAEPY